MSELVSFHNLVGGKQLNASGGQTFESFNPYTGSPWALIPRCNSTDVDAAVSAAKKAFVSSAWRGLTATARGALLMRLAALVEREAERLAALETRDNGKLIAEMLGQLRYIP